MIEMNIIEKLSVIYSFEIQMSEAGKLVIELWKDIEGFEGSYQVSSTGRVRSLDREVITKNGQKRNYKGKLMKQRPDKDGYLMVTLSLDGKYTTFQAHRLVAEAFIENSENKSEVNHIDLVKDNNSVENLEWTTRQENADHYADSTGTKKEALIERVKEEPDVYYKDLMEEFGFSMTLTYKLRNKTLEEMEALN